MWAKLLAKLLFLLVFACSNASLTVASEASSMTDREVSSDQYIPPKITFRGLSRARAEGHMQNKRLTADEWKHMQETAGRYGLPKFRRGLYVTESPQLAIKYADNVRLVADEDSHTSYDYTKFGAILIVEIDDKCLDPKNVATYSQSWMVHPDKDEKFSLWLANHKDQRRIKTECLNKDGYFGAGKNPYLEHGDESFCSNAFSDWLDTFKTIVDVKEPKSWYFRDPTCVQEFKGNPDEILQLYLNHDEILDINTNMATFEKSGAPMLSALLIESLANSTQVTRDSLKILDKKLMKLKQQINDDEKEFGATLITRYLTKAQIAMQSIVTQATTCSDQGKFHLFQSALKGPASTQNLSNGLKNPC